LRITDHLENRAKLMKDVIMSEVQNHKEDLIIQADTKIKQVEEKMKPVMNLVTGGIQAGNAVSTIAKGSSMIPDSAVMALPLGFMLYGAYNPPERKLEVKNDQVSESFHFPDGAARKYQFARMATSMSINVMPEKPRMKLMDQMQASLLTGKFFDSTMKSLSGMDLFGECLHDGKPNSESPCLEDKEKGIECPKTKSYHATLTCPKDKQLVEEVVEAVQATSEGKRVTFKDPIAEKKEPEKSGDAKLIAKAKETVMTPNGLEALWEYEIHKVLDFKRDDVDGMIRAGIIIGYSKQEEAAKWKGESVFKQNCEGYWYPYMTVNALLYKHKRKELYPCDECIGHVSDTMPGQYTIAARKMMFSLSILPGYEAKTTWTKAVVSVGKKIEENPLPVAMGAVSLVAAAAYLLRNRKTPEEQAAEAKTRAKKNRERNIDQTDNSRTSEKDIGGKRVFPVGTGANIEFATEAIVRDHHYVQLAQPRQGKGSKRSSKKQRHASLGSKLTNRRGNTFQRYGGVYVSDPMEIGALVEYNNRKYEYGSAELQNAIEQGIRQAKKDQHVFFFDSDGRRHDVRGWVENGRDQEQHDRDLQKEYEMMEFEKEVQEQLEAKAAERAGDEPIIDDSEEEGDEVSRGLAPWQFHTNAAGRRMAKKGRSYVGFAQSSEGEDIFHAQNNEKPDHAKEVPCEVCGIYIQTCQVEAHLAGQKHAKQLKALEKLKVEIQKPIEPTVAEAKEEVLCEVCGLLVQTVNLEDHLKGKKHAQKLKAVENAKVQVKILKRAEEMSNEQPKAELSQETKKAFANNAKTWQERSMIALRPLFVKHQICQNYARDILTGQSNQCPLPCALHHEKIPRPCNLGEMCKHGQKCMFQHNTAQVGQAMNKCAPAFKTELATNTCIVEFMSEHKTTECKTTQKGGFVTLSDGKSYVATAKHGVQWAIAPPVVMFGPKGSIRMALQPHPKSREPHGGFLVKGDVCIWPMPKDNKDAKPLKCRPPKADERVRLCTWTREHGGYTTTSSETTTIGAMADQTITVKAPNGEKVPMPMLTLWLYKPSSVAGDSGALVIACDHTCVGVHSSSPGEGLDITTRDLFARFSPYSADWEEAVVTKN